MKRLGFDNKWRTLVGGCIHMVSFSILVNGLIQPSKGLHQGDPLSPYLFLLCVEGLHVRNWRKYGWTSKVGMSFCIP